MADEDQVLCYNRGCSKKQFKLSENNSSACTFHPGEPYFHDAYKEWTCCKKRSTDFTEFLNYKGCKTSFHNHVKPVEKEKPKAPQEEIPVPTPPKPREPLARPDKLDPFVPLNVQVTASLKSALTEQIGKLKSAGGGDGDEKDVVKEGDPCKNSGCSAKFSPNDHSECVYHPGGPVFHEGMKYWSCCQRKTSEFDQFLKQEGCERGSHVWRKSEAEMKAVPTCRTDWFQTGSDVHAMFFAKNCIPEKCVIEANAVALHVKLVFDAGQSFFDKTMELDGIIDVRSSEVTLAQPKVEIRLKKAEPVAWKSLEIK